MRDIKNSALTWVWTKKKFVRALPEAERKQRGGNPFNPLEPVGWGGWAVPFEDCLECASSSYSPPTSLTLSLPVTLSNTVKFSPTQGLAPHTRQQHYIYYIYIDISKDLRAQPACSLESESFSLNEAFFQTPRPPFEHIRKLTLLN